MAGGKGGKRGREPYAVQSHAIPADKQRLYKILDVPRRLWGTPAGSVVSFAHSLTIPSGIQVGAPLRLRSFQIDFIEDVYNPLRPNGRRLRREAVLSIGRRNGKTLLAAVLLLTHLIGPMKKANSSIASAATSREQAAVVFEFAAAMVRSNPWCKAQLKIIDSTKRMIVKADMSLYRALSADSGTNLGRGLDFIVYDEYAQARDDSLYTVLKTSTGSQPEPMMMVISTQAPSDQHPLSILIDDGLKMKGQKGDDGSLTVHLYAAPKDCDLLDETAWRAANPALGDYRDMTELRESMTRAKRLPSLENKFRNLYLNQRVSEKAGLVSPTVWDQGNRSVAEDLFYSGKPVYAGLDLSSKIDLTACVFAVEEEDDGPIHLLPYVWTPGDTMAERATRDRTPYEAFENMRLLEAIPGVAISYNWVAQRIAEITERMNLVRVTFDRWRIDVLQEAFMQIGFYCPLVPMGQGYKDMSPAVEAFQELALMGSLIHGGNPLLRVCMGNVAVQVDPAGNQKLDKANSWGRIDPAVAAVMAIGGMKANAEPIVDVGAMIR